MAFYDAPHVLNAGAVGPRSVPTKRLRLKLLDRDELAKILELK